MAVTKAPAVLRIRVQDGDGNDITSFATVTWNILETGICRLSHGLEHGQTGRFLHGLRPGSTTVVVGAFASKPNEGEFRAPALQGHCVVR